MKRAPDSYRCSQRMLLAGALLLASAGLVFWFLYFALYWPYRDLFDEEGRYFDEASVVVYQQQSGVLIAPALTLSCLAIVCGAVWWMRRRAVPARIR